MMKSKFRKWTFLLAGVPLSLFSQNIKQDSIQEYRFTFDEAIEYGAKNNYTIQNATYDIEAADKRVWETISEGLPQVDGRVNYTNNLKQLVSVLPGDTPGSFQEVVFGTKQNMVAGIGLDQLIFSGNYLVGIQSSKVFKEVTELAKSKSEIDIKTLIAQAYGTVIIAEENVGILERNITVAKKNLFESSETYKAGFIELQSVEQLELSLAQLKNAHNRAKRLVEVSKNNLKYVMGIPIKEEITLEDNVDYLITDNLVESLLEDEFSVENNIDYLISQNTIKSNELLVKLNKSNALPTLSGTLDYTYVKNSEDFPLWDDNFNWNPSLVLGVNLNVPIFSSFKRRSQRQQAEIELEKAMVSNKQLEEQLELNIRTQRTNYLNSVETYYTSRDNMELANRIYKKETIKYFEGISTSNDLRQSETQYYSSQSDYTSSISDLINSKIELDKALNKYN